MNVRYPRIALIIICLSSLYAGGPRLAAAGSGTNAPATWRLPSGENFPAEIAGVTGPLVALSDGKKTALLSVADLEETELDRVAVWIVQQTAARASGTETLSPVGKQLRGKLVAQRDGQLQPWEPAAGPEPEIYLVYFSAHWCGPCRAFTPKLAEAYRRLKADPALGSKFELVFVSSDHSSGEQQDYIRAAQMPWPALKYGQLGNADLLERWAGSGIPCLVAVNRHGAALFHSYRGKEYVGPQEVLQKTEALLAELDPRRMAGSPAGHRLAVRVHMRTHPTGNVAPKPYLLALNRNHYQTLTPREFTAQLQVNTEGKVVDVTTEPALNAIYAQKFAADAGAWLFLPALQEGKPSERTVRVPVKL